MPPLFSRDQHKEIDLDFDFIWTHHYPWKLFKVETDMLTWKIFWLSFEDRGGVEG